MKLRRILEGETPVVQIAANTGWVRVSRALAALAPSHSEAETALWSRDTIALLGAPEEVRSGLTEAALGLAPDDAIAGRPLLPFEPRSFRDFMLYERHAIDAARGFVRRFTPRAWPVVKAYEAVFRRPFPALRPDALWNRQPIYYMGNHLAFALDGERFTLSLERSAPPTASSYQAFRRTAGGASARATTQYRARCPPGCATRKRRTVKAG